MFIFCIVLVLIASVLIILAVLVQSPKSGMAANFGASNQVLGVRQTADFLEKFTWSTAGVILALCLCATTAMHHDLGAGSTGAGNSDAEKLQEVISNGGDAMQQLNLPSEVLEGADAQEGEVVAAPVEEQAAEEPASGE